MKFGVALAAMLVTSAAGSQTFTPAVVAVHYISEVSTIANPPGIEFGNYVLFRDGSACGGCFNDWVARPNFMAELRKTKPTDVLRWQRVGDRNVIRFPSHRSTMSFHAVKDVFKPMVAGKRFNVRLKNAAGSGSDLYSDYFEFVQFFADGRFALINDTVIANGTYAINGYTIRLSFTRGTTKQFSIAQDASDPHFLMIDGTGFYVPTT